MLFGPELLAGLRFQEPDVKFGDSPFQPFGPAFAERSSFAQFGFFFPQCLYKVAASFLASREVSHRARVFQLQAFGKFEPSPSKSWDSFNTHKVFFIDYCPFRLLPDLWVLFSRISLPREAAQCSCTKNYNSVLNIYPPIWFLRAIPSIVSFSVKALYLATLEAA